MRKLYKVIFLLSILFLMQACADKIDAERPTVTVAIDGGNSSFLANGITRVKLNITLALPEGQKVSDANRKIVLQSNALTFDDLDANGQKIISIVPGINFSVTGTVKATPGSFLIRAFVKDVPEVEGTSDITLTAVTADAVITNLALTIPAEGVFANGTSVIRGSLKLENTSVKSVEVSLSDTGAKLLNANNGVVQADQNGNVDFSFQVSTNPGDHSATVKLSGDSGFFDTSDYQTKVLNNTDVIGIAITDQEVRADGISAVEGTVILKNTNLQQITLTTNKGSFVRGSMQRSKDISVDQNGEARFEVFVESTVQNGTNEEEYIVRAQLKESTFSAEGSFLVKPALPSLVSIQTNKFEVNTEDDTVNLNIFFSREKGSVSDGVRFDIRAYQDNNGVQDEKGRFVETPFYFVANQTKALTFRTDTRQPVVNLPLIIEVSVDKDDGTKLIETISLTVK